MTLIDTIKQTIIASMGQDRILAGESWEDEINRLSNLELLELISSHLEQQS